MYLGPIGQNCTSRSRKNSILSLVMSQNFGQHLNNSFKIPKNAENTPFSIPTMIHIKRTTFVGKLSHKLMIKFVTVQPPNCQKSKDCTTQNNYNLLSDSNSCCQHFVHKLMVDDSNTDGRWKVLTVPEAKMGAKCCKIGPKFWPNQKCV
jgi:hypothetical protein